MSISRNILICANRNENQFINEFSFYLDAIDRLYLLGGEIGDVEIHCLPKESHEATKVYWSLYASAITTSAGVLRLCSGNLSVDALALLRILCETAAILNYGNEAPENSKKIYSAIFDSGKVGKEQVKSEKDFTDEAMKRLKEKDEAFKEMMDLFNNRGSHISRGKVLEGNIHIFDGAVVPALSIPSPNKNLCLCLDRLFYVMLIITREYGRYFHTLNVPANGAYKELRSLFNDFSNDIQPTLSKMISDK